MDRPRPYLALRHRDFRHLSLATLVSLAGTQMQNVAIEWHIYVLTHSALALGATGLVRVVPILAFSLFGGVLADRFDRRRVMFAAESLMALSALVLAALTWTGAVRLWEIYLLTGISAAAMAFDNPARQALVPRLVPEKDLPGALALNLTFFHVAFIAGPALTGILLAAGARPGGTSDASLAAIYVINAASFGAVLVALVTMKTSGRVVGAGAPREAPVRAVAAGLRFVFTTPILVGTILVDFFATFFSGAMTLLPIFADRILHAGPQAYGWMRSAPAVGALAGSLLTSLRPLPRREGRVFLWCVAAYGVFTVVFGLSRSFWLTLAALAGTGLSDVISTVIRQTIRQLETPDAMRGRMTSVAMIFFLGGPQLGEFEAGALASAFPPLARGAMISVATGGVATLAATAAAAAFFPSLRRFRRDRARAGL